MTPDDIRSQIAEVSLRIADLQGTDDSAQISLDHCALQIKCWRLLFALASIEGDNELLRQASKEAENWEKRKGEFLKVAKIDLYKDLMRKIDEMESAANQLAGLVETDSEPDDENSASQ